MAAAGQRSLENLLENFQDLLESVQDCCCCWRGVRSVLLSRLDAKKVVRVDGEGKARRKKKGARERSGIVDG